MPAMDNLTVAIDDCIAEGYEAYEDGYSIEANPYSVVTNVDAWSYWRCGWRNAQEDGNEES